MTHKLIKTTDYILVVDDSEIQKGDCYLSPSGIWFYNHLNPNHNKESKKVCAHLPLNGSPILEGVDLLPPIEDDVVELAESFCKGMSLTTSEYRNLKFGYAEGYIRARERYKYTEEDMRKAIAFGGTKVAMKESLNSSDAEEFIQSIHQYPTEFECEIETTWARNTDRNTPTKDDFDYKPKTITTAQGVQWVGKYN